jgi:glycerate kinase
MRILVAPDKFKGSLGADAVGRHIAIGLRAVLPRAEIEILPVADGGEGTAAIISQARGGEMVACASHDALGRSIRAPFCWIAADRTAVVEMSASAGLAQLAPNERDPLCASTFGVGEMVLAAAARGARKIVVGLGGSATNDGGAGLARALGFRFFAAGGRELSALPSSLPELIRIEVPNELQLPPLEVAADVRNPLLGCAGASRTFALQKGAQAQQIDLLEEALTRLADVAANTFARDQRDQPGAGAAGGLGFGLLTFCRATLRPGFEVVAEAIDLQRKLRWADLVVTGEGRLDRQTLAGKAPAGVARMARMFGKPVFALVGASTDEAETDGLFDEVFTLGDSSETADALEARAREIGRKFAAR